MSNGAPNVDRSGHCTQPDELKRVLTAEILQMEHEVATGLVRTAVEEGRIGRAERIVWIFTLVSDEAERRLLVEQIVHTNIKLEFLGGVEGYFHGVIQC